MFKKLLLFVGGAVFGAYTMLCTVVTVTSLKAFCDTKTRPDETTESETKTDF